MKRVAFVAFFVALALACGPDKGQDSDSPIDSEDTGDPIPEVSFAVAWDGAGVDISIANGSGGYTLGLVETTPGSPDPWTGEDCLNGYTLGGGNVLLYCHPMSDSGGYLESVDAVSQIVEGDTTLFNSSFEANIGYVLISDSTTECWTLGAQAATYYAELGCTAL